MWRLNSKWRNPSKKKGERFICIASGPSLTKADCEKVQGAGKIIAVNDCYRLAPFADHLYAADGKWWLHYGDEVHKTFRGQCWIAVRGDSEKTHAQHLQALDRFPWLMAAYGAPRQGLGRTLVHWGGNSGYAAINMAYLLGANEIWLLGYDHKGKGHWFGEHPDGPMRTNLNFQAWITAMGFLAADLIEAGVRVINCSRDTAITAFERKDLDECLRNC